MALVITLIMLSVTLVMAIAFLAISRRERVSVTTATDTTVARLAADSALAAAQAQIVADCLTDPSSFYNHRLIVATNYINPSGYFIGIQNPVNVNYDFRNVDGQPLNSDDLKQNIANLMILPRAPVMVSATEPYAGRFYLDLNRNGAFEDTGNLFQVVDDHGNTNILSSPFSVVGDPQWVGILERPNSPHSADNKFVSRYTFYAQPVDEALDLNFIHNAAVNKTVKPSPNASGIGDSFLRNQGVGSWELNLAAFLADLNTNQWNNPLNLPYQFYEPYAVNQGNAFDDALAMLSWRYNYSYANLASMNFIFGTPNPFALDNTDEYSDGPPQLAPANINESLVGNADAPALSWPGADNPNKFFTPSDFFDQNKSRSGFVSRLQNAGTNSVNGKQPTYDRYTFYRMLEQLATDSLVDDGKMNLNWRNVTNGQVIVGMETNLYQWSAIEFFTNAVDRMLRTYTTNWFRENPQQYLSTFYGFTYSGNIDPATGYGLTNAYFPDNTIPAFGLGNLPVLISNRFVYSPAVNRLIQLAANIYDASNPDFYPHVFRPTFMRSGSDVFIIGFQEVPSGSALSSYLTAPMNVEALTTFSAFTSIYENVYGIPWIIGAKKNLPNFNSLYSFNNLTVIRKLQFNRDPAAIGQTWNPNTGISQLYRTNQMITVGVTNAIGFSFWNSYNGDYPNAAANYPFATPDLYVRVIGASQFMLSNSFGVSYVNPPVYNYPPTPSSTFSKWPGSDWNKPYSNNRKQNSPDAASFIASETNFTILPTDSLLFDNSGNFLGYTTPGFNLGINVTPVFPHILLYATNYFQAYILDHDHVIDYVQFKNTPAPADLANEVNERSSSSYWSTNLLTAGIGNGLNYGVYNQIVASGTASKLNPNGQQQAALFSAFFKPSFTYPDPLTGKSITVRNTNTTIQAGYTPSRAIIAPSIWSANDPLVHYLTSDLKQTAEGADANGLLVYNNPLRITQGAPSLVTVGDRYQPWGQREINNSISGVLNNQDESKYLSALKDPLVYGSDYWDFPTNSYPTVGWLGRVHRGTPWQTVFLKATNIIELVDINPASPAPNIGLNTWMMWSGDNNSFDAKVSRPVRDGLLFDIFTASPAPNAAHGALSVNAGASQPDGAIASWSALFSGLVVLTNMTDVPPNFDVVPVLTNTIINPAGPDLAGVSALSRLVKNITDTRTNFNGGHFNHIGDILRTPALSDESPFINFNDVANGNDRRNFDISDAVYEWLPQQTLGLLRISTTPRYVVYCYGQTLKPAPGGVVLDGSQYFNLITNYTVVAESATRTVVTVRPQIQFNGTNGVQTNFTTHVENFSVLPPE